MRQVRVAGGSRRGAGTHHFLGVTRGTGLLRVSQSLGTFWQRLREVWESND